MIVRFDYGELRGVRLENVLSVRETLHGTWVSIAEILEAWNTKGRS